MEDQELRQKFDELEKKIDAAYMAAERSRKYLFWTGVVTLALIVIPAIGVVFVIPSFLNTYAQIDLIQ